MASKSIENVKEDGEIHSDDNSSSDSDSDSSSESEQKDEKSPPALKFKNDGSFMEMFKKMQEQQQQKNGQEAAGNSKVSHPKAEAPSTSTETESPKASESVKKPGLMSVVSTDRPLLSAKSRD
jgi:hypothetical protein